MTPLQFISYAEQMLRPTEPLFALIPQDKIEWKPTPESFSCGQLMMHMAQALRFNADGIAKNEWALPSLRHIFLANRRVESATREQAIALYKENAEYFYNVFRSMSEGEFVTATINTPQFGLQEKWRYALFAVAHHLNHKAELFMYLKTLGATVGSRELYGG